MKTIHVFCSFPGDATPSSRFPLPPRQERRGSSLRSVCGILVALITFSLTSFLPAAVPPPMLGTPVLVTENNYQWLEGARWDSARDRLLFSDPHGDTLYELKRDGAVAVIRTPTRKANNLEFDPQGRLVACEITGRVSRFSLTDGSVVDAVSDYAGQTLKFPNDLAICADGTIYFSDSKVPRIFRIDPAGRLHGAVPEGSGDAGANGLALSPNQSILYVAFTSEGLLRAYDVEPSGGLAGRRVVAKTEKSPDGLCVDREGNIYVGTVAGVQVFSPTGKELGVLALPNLSPKDRVTKAVFGGADGRTLFVLVPSKLFRVPATIAGWPSQPAP